MKLNSSIISELSTGGSAHVLTAKKSVSKFLRMLYISNTRKRKIKDDAKVKVTRSQTEVELLILLPITGSFRDVLW